MAELEIREIKENEFPIWDKFVEDSKQYNLFSTSSWMEVLGRYPGGKPKLIGIFSSGQLVSGILLYERKKAFLRVMAYPPLTPFTTPIFKDNTSPRFSKIESLQKKIIQLLSSYLCKNYSYVALQLEPSIKDTRHFSWLGWKTSVSYTYEIGLSDIKGLWNKIDKDAKYEIDKAKSGNVKITEGGDIGIFLELYEKTFLKQNIKPPLNRDFIREAFGVLKAKNQCRLYFAAAEGNEISGAMVVWDRKKAYYLLAASEPGSKPGANYLLLWHIIEDMSKKFSSMDLVGANIPNIIKFKREFATNLVHYFVVEKYSSLFVKILEKLYRKLT